MTQETIVHDLREISKMNSASSHKRMVCAMAADTIENQAKALDALTLANMALKEKAERRGWIPVKEALPKPFESVLLHTPDEAPLPTVHEGYIDNKGGWHRTSVFEAGYVTHWMPMPEVPNDEL